MQSESSMRRLRAAIGMAVAGIGGMALLTGCQARETARLTGEWELVDPSRLAGRINQDAPDGALPGSHQMTVRFGSGGTLTTRTHMGDLWREKSGTWKVLASSADRTSLAFTLSGERDELEIEWIDDDTLKMVPPNMAGLTMKLTFRRKKS